MNSLPSQSVEDAASLLRLENASLCVHEGQRSIRQIVTSLLKHPTKREPGRTDITNLVLLDSLNFELREGDRVGLIGRNGAGKSTLLRVLGQIYPITHGKIYLNCDTKGLFSATHGLLNSATGIENIFYKSLNDGMDMSQVEEHLNEVVEFAELGPHIDRPIENYSTGMRMRLAIAISLMMDADVLLLDEWIGSADAEFRQKIKKRLFRIIDKTRGLILASHNHRLLSQVCKRGIVMADGRIVFDGSIDDAIAYFDESIHGSEDSHASEKPAV